MQLNTKFCRSSVSDILDLEFGTADSSRVVIHQMPEYLVGRQLGIGHRSIHGHCVGVEAVSDQFERLLLRVKRNLPWSLQLECFVEFLQKVLLIGLVAVQFDAHWTKSDMFKPSLNDFQGCHLLTDEQNFFSVCHSRCQDIRDGL